MAILTAVVALAFVQGCCVLWLLQCLFLSFEPMQHPFRLCICVVLPALVGLRAYKRRKLTLGGTLCGILIGFVLMAVHLSLFLALCAFFFAGTAATKFNASRKAKKVKQQNASAVNSSGLLSLLKRGLRLRRSPQNPTSTSPNNVRTVDVSKDTTEAEGEVRDSLQVLCNGLVAAVSSVLFCVERSINGCACETNLQSGATNLRNDRFDSLSSFLVYLIFGDAHVRISFVGNCFLESSYLVAILSSIACACGDTLASELGGSLSFSDPRLITTLRRVPRGTNGGVSVIGLIFSALGGAMVALPFLVTCVLHELVACSNDSGSICSEEHWGETSALYNFKIVRIAADQVAILPVLALAGLLGSLIDSFIGATLQYSGLHKKSGRVVSAPNAGEVEHISGLFILDNNAVNFVSTVLTALIMPFVARCIWPH